MRKTSKYYTPWAPDIDVWRAPTTKTKPQGNGNTKTPAIIPAPVSLKRLKPDPQWGEPSIPATELAAIARELRLGWL